MKAEGGSLNPEPETRGNILVIPFKGCVGCNVDVADIADKIRHADSDPAVSAIIIDFDSPGGEISGLTECADAVVQCRKPVIAWVRDLCASAAYWVACHCDSVCIGETAEIGSVGVYCLVPDVTKMFSDMGVKMELFASGENKGIGVEGTSMTEGQKKLMQEQVDYLADIFKRAVLSNRDIDPELLDGRCLIGGQAVEAGFADRTCCCLTGAMAAAREFIDLEKDNNA